MGEHGIVIGPTIPKALGEILGEVLEAARKNGYEVVTGSLLERGAVSATQDQGNTTIHLAVNAGIELVIKRLLESGLNTS